jgi:hypothetical protein
MGLNGTGIEFGKSEHVFRWRISRATTISADKIVLGQRCGVQVFCRNVYRVKRLYPVGEAGGGRTVTDRTPNVQVQHLSSSLTVWRGGQKQRRLVNALTAVLADLRPAQSHQHTNWHDRIDARIALHRLRSRSIALISPPLEGSRSGARERAALQPSTGPHHTPASQPPFHMPCGQPPHAVRPTRRVRRDRAHAACEHRLSGDACTTTSDDACSAHLCLTTSVPLTLAAKRSDERLSWCAVGLTLTNMSVLADPERALLSRCVSFELRYGTLAAFALGSPIAAITCVRARHAGRR